jgi:hypothetical protein
MSPAWHSLQQSRLSVSERLRLGRTTMRDRFSREVWGVVFHAQTSVNARASSLR